MCFGGGGSPATIYAPDYSAYDREFALQKAAIEQSMSSNSQLMQTQLNAALRQQGQVKEDSVALQRQLAENSSAQAMRMAQLIGTPPPEKTADAPVVAGNRNPATNKGKSALRIERQTATSSGAGSGLNIS
jgi:hypothetical protein